MPESVETHRQEIQQWLEDNVQSYSTPQRVTLKQFDVNWQELSGVFSVELDGLQLPTKFRFQLEASGKTSVRLPMIHSPMGAPASYRAVEITEATEAAIAKALHQTIPRIRGCGVDPKTGQQIAFHTPVSERIVDQSLFLAAQRELGLPTFSVSVLINAIETSGNL